MRKLLTLLTIILGGCLVAGLYGILHDQLTYSISPEYYTKFKFDQFGLMYDGNDAIVEYPRIFVSIVGFLATWWVGPPIALGLGLFSIHSDKRFMLEISFKGFIVVIFISFLSGLYGLYRGFTYLSQQPREMFHRWFIPDDLVDFESFIAVGSMHNSSYVGGFIGLFAGIAYVGWRKGMSKTRLKDATER